MIKPWQGGCQLPLLNIHMNFVEDAEPLAEQQEDSGRLKSFPDYESELIIEASQ